MSSFSRILCALGGTPSSEAALSFAVDLAARTHGVVDVVHPLPRERLEHGGPASSANELRAWRDAVRDVERRICRATRDVGVVVRPHVRSGSLAQAVAFVAESERSDLVVVSRHTLRALREDALDEELFALEGGGGPPLLVLPERPVRRGAGGRPRVLATLLASDGDGHPELQTADALCAALDGDLLVTHAGDRFSARALAAAADHAKADFVVVEKPNEGRLARALHLRSAGERLVDRSRRPVLLVGPAHRRYVHDERHAPPLDLPRDGLPLDAWPEGPRPRPLVEARPGG